MASLLGDGEELQAQPAEDLWVGESDPWTWPTAQGQPSTPARGRGQTSTTGVTIPGQEPPPQRIVHDILPSLGKNDPEKELEQYLKLFKGWLATARTFKTQQGVTILHHAHGDSKTAINE